MLDVIEKLLILQDRDRKIMRTRNEFAHIDPERKTLQAKLAKALETLENAKLRGKQIETDRKRLELEIEAYKEKIGKYSVQQFQTKKNEEFRAIGNEIETCKKNIFQLENQELELMEQAEVAAKQVAEATRIHSEDKKRIDGQMIDLAGREQNLKKELDELMSNRSELSAVVDDSALARYERLLKSKGENILVGISNGVCGGCHMKFPMQIIVSCKREEEIVTCPNCARILYYTRDMDLAVAD
ncbi:MAG: chromosome segregation protein [Verrucomicrobiales bacterium]|nr:chromosome segregation protein [Verrucomicrobiales bacterium]